MDQWRAAQPEPGTRIWEAVSRFGRDPKFASASDLWSACVEYFEWVENTPLVETRAFPTKDQVRVEMFPKMRAMTISGLCLFLDIAYETWRAWKTPENDRFRADFVVVISRVESVIYQQKFTAASVGLLNGNLIARELGLADKSEVTGKDGGAIEHNVKARIVRIPPKVPASTEVRPMPSEGDGAQ